MGGSTLPTIAGWVDGKPYVFCETFMGTWGAAQAHDGQEGVPHMGANQSNVPVEMIETGYPLRIVRYGFLPDTGGAGKFRGGVSIVREFEMLADDAVLNVRSDKRRFPPHGLFGGEPGTPSLNYLTHKGKDRLLPALLMETEPMHEGRPLPRHPGRRRRLRRSVRARSGTRARRRARGKAHDRIRAQALRRRIKKGPRFAIDMAATKKLRGRQRKRKVQIAAE